jgi:hypothetical protein
MVSEAEALLVQWSSFLIMLPSVYLPFCWRALFISHCHVPLINTHRQIEELGFYLLTAYALFDVMRS